MQCGANEIFDTRSECPKTCLDQTGNRDCGITIPTEGCYCKEGYVLDPNGVCVLPQQCGCLLPDLSTIISVINKLNIF